jgi:hypothetical protein
MKYKIIDRRNGRVLAICPTQTRLDFMLSNWARYRRFLEVVEEPSTPSS